MTNTVLAAMSGIDEGYLAECEAIRAGGLPPKKTPQLPSWLEMLGYVALILIVLGSVIVVPGMLRRQPQESVGSESNTETDTTEDTEPPESEPTQSMDLNRYMRFLTTFFYEPCDKLDPKAFRDDILGLLFSFSYNYGEELGFAAWDEARAEESLLVIQGEGLRKVGKMLLGDDFDAREYHDTLDWGEYIEETDIYEVSFGTDYRGGELVEIVFGTQPTITETADGAEVVVALRFDDLGDIASTDEGIPDAPPVFFLRYTFRSVVSDGFRYYRLVSIATVDDLTLQTTPLTAAQLQAFEDFLNDPENNGFVGFNRYPSPDKIDLNAVFYDGAGFETNLDQWSEAEKQAVLAALDWGDFIQQPTKIPRAYADRLLKKKLGLSLADFNNEIRYFTYVEACDAYYDIHGDTNIMYITVLGGEIDKNGRYTVRYANEDYLLDEVFTVTLCKTEEGFRFLSNVSDDVLQESPATDFDYKMGAAGIYIMKYKGDSSTVVFPSIIEGEKVTRIGSSVFYGKETLVTTAVLPETVTTIWDHAFYGCSSLTTVVLSKNLMSIEPYAFKDCENLSTIMLPSTLTTIGDHAFENCISLKHINIPGGLTDWGKGAFLNAGIETIEFEEGLDHIGFMAFCGTKVKEVTTPKSLTYIDYAAFWNCNDLESFVLNDGLLSAGASVVSSEKLTEIIIPRSVELLDASFRGCKNLKKILFEGNAPRMIRPPILETCVVYYHEGAEGFTSPEWNGYLTQPIPGTLTAAQLQAFEEYLNDPANNGFVSHNFYASPDKIDLNAVFYDGAGIGIPSWEWDDEEKQGVLDAVGWEEYFTTAIKIPRAEADRLLRERLGLSLADFDNKIPHFHYVEAYDAYYAMHGDTNLLPITVLDGEIDENGVYTVRYASEYASDGIFAATLCRAEEGFRFLSNMSNEDETNMTGTSAFEIDVQPSDAEGTESPDYVHYVDESGEVIYMGFICDRKDGGVGLDEIAVG